MGTSRRAVHLADLVSSLQRFASAAQRHDADNLHGPAMRTERKLRHRKKSSGGGTNRTVGRFAQGWRYPHHVGGRSWHVGSAWGRAHGGCDDQNPQRFSAFCVRDLVRDGDRARGSKAAHLTPDRKISAYPSHVDEPWCEQCRALARRERRRKLYRSWNKCPFSFRGRRPSL